MKLKDQKIPSVILAIGIALYGISLLMGDWYRWIPASFSIDLRPSISNSPSFRVNLSTEYLIELEVERNMPFEQLNCILGVDLTPKYREQRCRAIPSPIDLKWQVFSSGVLVAEGTSQYQHSGGWGSTISRTIGRFRGNKGQEYIVQVESLKDASVLAPTNPRINVGVHPIESKSYYVTAQLVSWVALVFGVVGLLWLLAGILRWFLERLKMNERAR